MKSDVPSLLAQRTSALGRRWELRDSASYVHVDTVDGPTRVQGVIAHNRDHGGPLLDGLMDPRIERHMPDPSVLTDMDAAAERLAQAIQNGEDLLVFGDYDVDGATSTAIVQRFLRMAGHDTVTTIIPDREYGYGFGEDALRDAMAKMPELILLLDCGTQNGETIAKARAAGVDVLVVDHHKPGHALPPANALVNPHREDETEAGQTLRGLCTAGLAFMLCVATNRTLRGQGRWRVRPEPKLPTLLDLVALGTVCDVMPLTGLNRSFVTAGLKRLDRGDNVGLAALSRAAGVRDGATVTSFGFHLGPRINAGGRVGRARLGADLLSSDDPTLSDALAKQLNHLNQERQRIEKQVQAEAMALLDPDADVIVVAGQGWHEGVIGIVAGRLKETYNRPVVVMAIREDGVVKGSGRSIAGVDLGAAVMAAKDAGILVAGGGHTMACGLSATPDRIDDLRAFLIERLGAASNEARDANATKADAALWTSDLTMGFHDEIERMGPYGQGWPKPRFILGPAKASSVRVVGDSQHAFFDLVDDNGSIKAKAWRAGESDILKALESADRILALGHVEIDTYRGSAELNFIVEDVIRLTPTTAPASVPHGELLHAF